MRKLLIHFCDFVFGKHKNNTLPRIWILAVDMAIVLFSIVVAIFMLYYNDIRDSVFDWSRIWLIPVVYLIAFLVSRTYDGMLRYSGFNDIQKIFFACFGALSFLLIGKLVISNISPSFATRLFPRYATIIYHFLITIVSMIIMRFTIRRLYNEVYKNTADSDKQNTIIYGHHMKSGRMFAPLEKYKSQSYYDAHPYMYIYTESQNYRIDLFAGCVVEGDADIYATSVSADILANYVAKSTFKSKIGTPTGKIVTLSTCDYTSGYSDPRYVVLGQLVPID